MSSYPLDYFGNATFTGKGSMSSLPGAIGTLWWSDAAVSAGRSAIALPSGWRPVADHQVLADRFNREIGDLLSGRRSAHRSGHRPWALQ
jgi:hypothetical protein